MQTRRDRVPVILDTDIGGDIDDTWALCLLLRCPELDVKLIVSDTGDTLYRSKIIAKMLQTAGRTDIPIGIGTRFEVQEECRQRPWVETFELGNYAGTVHEDGVAAIIHTIMTSLEPVTLICIGAVPNIAEALVREPRIADHARFVGMQGSIYKGYHGSDQISPECNVANHSSACQKAFRASWDITITPLDTSELVRLKGEKFQAVRRCPDPLIQALMENYRLWLLGDVSQADVESSVLYDTVAVYLAFCEDLLEVEELGIRVTDDGYTVRDETAKPIRVAVRWKDLGGFEDFLVDRLARGWPKRVPPA